MLNVATRLRAEYQLKKEGQEHLKKNLVKSVNHYVNMRFDNIFKTLQMIIKENRKIKAAGQPGNRRASALGPLPDLPGMAKGCSDTNAIIDAEKLV